MDFMVFKWKVGVDYFDGVPVESVDASTKCITVGFCEEDIYTPLLATLPLSCHSESTVHLAEAR